MIEYPLISYAIFFPLIGAGVLFLLNPKNEKLLKGFALFVSVIEVILTIPLFYYFQVDSSEMQFTEYLPWIPHFGIAYRVGLDGLSLGLVVLTTFLFFISILACGRDIQRHVKEFFICVLLMEAGLVGVFVALDVFLFYVFWEVSLVPMFFIIGVWGNPARRIYAAIKCVLFSMAGSAFMLVAIIYMCFYHASATGEYTFNLLKWYSLTIPPATQIWLFLAFGFAFAIKGALFPFHTWLPEAQSEAPMAGSVLLTALVLKMGAYGFLRFNFPLFPESATSPLIVFVFSLLAVVGIIYGAVMAIAQPNMKRLVAFSSVSCLGYVILGFFTFNPQGIQGGIMQMINHGLSAGALLLIIGMLSERRQTEMIAEFGGLAKVMPLGAVFFMIVSLSIIGLPGLNGFVGLFLVLLGIFRTNQIFAAFAATGIIWTSVYMLGMFQRVMFGEIKNPKNANLTDITKQELLVLVPLIIFIIWIGVYPKPFLKPMEATVNGLIQRVEQRTQVITNDLPQSGANGSQKGALLNERQEN